MGTRARLTLGTFACTRARAARGLAIRGRPRAARGEVCGPRGKIRGRPRAPRREFEDVPPPPPHPLPLPGNILSYAVLASVAPGSLLSHFVPVCRPGNGALSPATTAASLLGGTDTAPAACATATNGVNGRTGRATVSSAHGAYNTELSVLTFRRRWPSTSCT